VAGPNRNETFDVSTSTSPPLDHEALAGRVQTCGYRIEAYTAQIVAETPRFVWQMTQFELDRPQNNPFRRQRLVHLPRQRFLAFRAADRVPSIFRGEWCSAALLSARCYGSAICHQFRRKPGLQLAVSFRMSI
jgi:hypothetical protein